MRSRRAKIVVPEHAEPRGAPWSARGPAIALVAIVLLVFLRAAQNGFTGWDDTLYIVTNPLMRGTRGLARLWTSTANEQYYPLTFTSYWIEYQLWGARPAGYLITNVCLHALDALLVLLFLRALGVGRAAACAAALLYAVHPTHAMSVAWIAERKNLLSCVFTLCSLLAWIRFRRRSSEAAYVFALLFFLLALLSKTQILGVVFALWILDVCVLGARPAAASWRTLPLLALAVAALAVTLSFEQRFVDPTARDWVPPLVERVQIAALAPWHYLRQAVLPFSLAPIYPLWQPSASSWSWWVPVAALLALLLAGVQLRRRIDARLTLCLSLFVLPLLPSLGLIPFGNFAITHVSDHFMYVPLVGLCGAAGVGLSLLFDRVPRVRRAVAAAVVLICAAFAWELQRAIPVFKDGKSLWSRALERSPESYAAHLGLAEALRTRGDREGAARHYERAIGIRPGWVDAYQLFGQAELEAGDFERSEIHLRRALEISPRNVRALSSLGALLERTGRIEAALETYELAVECDGSWVPARLGLAQMYLGYARYDDAEQQFRALLAVRPGDARARLGVATCLRGRGEHASAVDWLRASLREVADDWSSLNMLALLLASSRDDRVRRGDEALELANRAARATRFDDPLVLDTLAAAQAEVGQASDAARTSQQAATVHEAHGDRAAADESRQRAAAYAQGHVLRR